MVAKIIIVSWICLLLKLVFFFPPVFCCKERVYYKNEQECKPWIKEDINKKDSIKSQNLQEEAVKQYPKILRGRKKCLGQNKAAA